MVPLAELGRSDRHLHCRTHLGHLLKPGDTAWGYAITFCMTSLQFPLKMMFCRFDFTKANLNDSNLEKMKPSDIPDVVRQ